MSKEQAREKVKKQKVDRTWIDLEDIKVLHIMPGGIIPDNKIVNWVDNDGRQPDIIIQGNPNNQGLLYKIILCTEDYRFGENLTSLLEHCDREKGSGGGWNLRNLHVFGPRVGSALFFDDIALAIHKASLC